MNPLVEFCVNNLVSGSQEAYEKLRQDPDLDVVEYGCTSNCGICAMSLFAIVEGRRILADTPDELVDRIYEYLDEEELSI
ncbi:uncharacterized protein YuzB (UPF0349 family) [Alkalibacillus filiformis]|uniref:UPF0349 protein YuzB n=2 Tax=Alkalibacillus TaxID=331654 RepID=A0A511W7H0_9BACI|nr:MULTISPECIES: YuzB family protein [Alkalibacillus]MDQ0352827.1 uncharacterized protein YuzB (UPF0349 family) [Alkalibacillus filiformis]MDV2582105.1 YuzB family protein [Alkalibacillus haloalkaliphilus]GEN47014.1 UPF0349 protein YuzB [Alkalibacillus haloalkaliphilus]